MGVPAFFRWLVQKYSRIVVDVIEEEHKIINDVEIPVNTSLPNPNKIEFDNLYLDMNGIIHPCTHPEDGPTPESEEEMLLAIGCYLGRIFDIVRPRKLLYLAIDGVAPRAKMNQQRSRRFRSSKEAKEKQESEKIIRREAELMGHTLPPIENKSNFDSNCITPGTEFMDKVSNYLQYYIADHIQSDPGWKNIKIILSDASIPGEGEHKIMEFIRFQRAQPGYPTQTRHCIYGLDADLIMLGLATHEPYFSILREVVTNNSSNCYICGQSGHLASTCTGKAKQQSGEFDEKTVKKKPFQFLHIHLLREYLNNSLSISDLPFEFNLERAIDDWVFLCFFVGNDFLPHLPTLEIRENAIDLLTSIYKQILPKTGYLTDWGKVNFAKLDVLLHEIANLEDSILANRRSRTLKKKEDMKRRKLENERMKQNQQAADSLRTQLFGNNNGETDSPKSSNINHKDSPKSETMNKSSEPIPEDEEPEDLIRLGDEGWKERYYAFKFKVKLGDPSSKPFFEKIRRSYVEGLAWVLEYYYCGCPSWTWYYPYHYAPFSSELCGISNFSIKFEKGAPYRPLTQLISVLPSSSGKLLPEKYFELMTSPDSPIIDFYPSEFVIDLNGKRFEWQGVAILPFIDEKRLIKALLPLEPTLTEEEQKRNSFSVDLLFVSTSHSLASSFQKIEETKSIDWIPLDINQSQGTFGSVSFHTDKIYQFGKSYPPPFSPLPPIESCLMLSVLYKNPSLPIGKGFVKGLVPGVVLPEKELTMFDFYGDRTGYARNQNSFANRVINHHVGDQQHKIFKGNHSNSYHPYSSSTHRLDYDPSRRQHPSQADSYRRDNHNTYSPERRNYSSNSYNNSSSSASRKRSLPESPASYEPPSSRLKVTENRSVPQPKVIPQIPVVVNPQIPIPNPQMPPSWLLPPQQQFPTVLPPPPLMYPQSVPQFNNLPPLYPYLGSQVPIIPQNYHYLQQQLLQQQILQQQNSLFLNQQQNLPHQNSANSNQQPDVKKK